jgi:2-C-methyl-D-erythritol 4-phosphate cytidylyltransferase/2-C-methyl-D-erythritol 2,4-cyclodiphosphate synthase
MTPLRPVADGPRRIWAVVPAAGRGARFAQPGESTLPKQYATVLGATVLEWSLRALLREPRIEGVVVVLAAGDAEWPAIAARLASAKLRVAIGGESRQASVMRGLERLGDFADPEDWALVHDAARPCLTAGELAALFAALDAGAPGAILAAPLVDTIKRERDGVIGATVERQGLWRALTPQVFRLAALRTALADATAGGAAVTDEAQAMERAGLAATLVAGSSFNIKVTRREDLGAAARILQTAEATTMRIGQGFDVHAFGPGEHVVLGGVRIAHSQGVIAHSDGDVVIHALCDAVLGALGRGDIGEHFPDSDPRYRNADSRLFLREVAALTRSAGFCVGNVDITVLAEAPRIGRHRAAMAANLGADLGLAPGLVNVKATTTERLGFIGRGEGLAAMATVLLQARSST